MEEAVTLLPFVPEKTKGGLDSTLKRLWQGVLKPYCVRDGGGKVGTWGFHPCQHLAPVVSEKMLGDAQGRMDFCPSFPHWGVVSEKA